MLLSVWCLLSTIGIKWFGFDLVSVIVERRCLHNAWVAAATEKIGERLMNLVVGESLSSGEGWAFSCCLLGRLSFWTDDGNVGSGGVGWKWAVVLAWAKHNWGDYWASCAFCQNSFPHLICLHWASWSAGGRASCKVL